MTKEEMLHNLSQQGYVRSPRVRDAFAHIDRADFIPEASRDEAHHDLPLPVGHEQVASQPHVVAFMLELLGAQAGEKILEIGTGSGWQTALLAHMVGESTSAQELQGKVIAFEYLEPLAELATKNLEHYHFISEGTVSVIRGSGTQGIPEEAPFDRVIASAASAHIPAAWKDQIRVGGRIVAPVGESIVVLDKTAPRSFSQRRYFGFDFAPLKEE